MRQASGNDSITIRWNNRKTTILIMKRKILLVVLMLGSLALTAQTLSVQGTVSDTSGETLIGASVLIKGTTVGTVTDFDGHYLLNNVPADAELEFSYMGYENQTVGVQGRTSIDVVLSDAGLQVEEVVV